MRSSLQEVILAFLDHIFLSVNSCPKRATENSCKHNLENPSCKAKINIKIGQGKEPLFQAQEDLNFSFLYISEHRVVHKLNETKKSLVRWTLDTFLT